MLKIPKITAFSILASTFISPGAIVLYSCQKPDPEPTKDWDIQLTNGWKLDYVYDDGSHKREYANFSFDLINFVGTEKISFEITSQKKDGVVGEYICFNDLSNRKEFDLSLGQTQLLVPIGLIDRRELSQSADIEFNLQATITWKDETPPPISFEGMWLSVSRPTTEDMFEFSQTSNGRELVGFKNDEETAMKLPYCSSLIIPEGVTSIADDAFFQEHSSTITDNFRFLVLDDYWGTKECQLTRIGDNAFRDAPFVWNLYLPKSIKYIGNYAFRNVQFSGQLKLPENLISIGDSAFDGCSQLSGDLVIPKTVESIGIKAFYNCYSLDNGLFFEKHILNMGNNAFDGCSNIKTIDFSHFVIEPQWLFDSLNHIFLRFTTVGCVYVPSNVDLWKNQLVNCCCLPSTWLVSLIDEDPIPQDFFILSEDRTKLFGLKPYVNLQNYKTLKIPYGVKEIVAGAFKDVFKSQQAPIKRINLFNGTLTIISDQAFENCSQVTDTLLIPEGVVSVGYAAFRGCSGLQKVILPKTLILGGKQIFKSCENLNYVDMTAITFLPNWLSAKDSQLFDGVQPVGTININENLNVDLWRTYLTANTSLPYDWNVWYEGNVVPNECFDINSADEIVSLKNLNLLSNCRTLRIPSTVTKIRDNVFSIPEVINSPIRNISFTNSKLSEIGNSAFSGCTNFHCHLTLPANIDTIGEKAFYKCNGLVGDLIICNSKSRGKTTFIGNEAFAYCTGINEINLMQFGSFVPSWAQPQKEQERKTNVFANLTDGGGMVKITNNLDLDKTLQWKEGLITGAGLSRYWTVASPNQIVPYDYYWLTDDGKTLYGVDDGPDLINYSTIKIPPTVEVIESGTFTRSTYWGTIVNLDLNNGHLKTIKMNAFKNIPWLELTNLNFPLTVSYIGQEAFYGDKISSSICLGQVSTIGDMAFAEVFFTPLYEQPYDNFLDFTYYTSIPEWCKKQDNKIFAFNLKTFAVKGKIYVNPAIYNNEEVRKEMETYVHSKNPAYLLVPLDWEMTLMQNENM